MEETLIKMLNALGDIPIFLPANVLLTPVRWSSAHEVDGHS